MENSLEISLCIPTNGIDDFIFEVLDSICSQNVSCNIYEVIIMDNGNNNHFKKKIKEYVKDKANFYYYETAAELFMGEIEAYKKARGRFIKFINHRTKLMPGTLKHYLDVVEKYSNQKSIIYFSNGVLNKNMIMNIKCFDDMIYNLSYWSSWSTGMGIWKEDFWKIVNSEDTHINYLFPHTSILFAIYKNREYVIDDVELLQELRSENIQKGNYDLFHAFCVEYPSILCDLYRNKYITAKTLKKVLDDNLNLIAFFYRGFVTFRKKTSYCLDGYDDATDIFYTKAQVEERIFKLYGEQDDGDGR